MGVRCVREVNARYLQHVWYALHAGVCVGCMCGMCACMSGIYQFVNERVPLSSGYGENSWEEVANAWPNITQEAVDRCLKQMQ